MEILGKGCRDELAFLFLHFDMLCEYRVTRKKKNVEKNENILLIFVENIPGGDCPKTKTSEQQLAVRLNHLKKGV